MFKSAHLKQGPSPLISEDRFREVELAVAFRRATCYRCGYISIYKYRVQQVRRRPEIVTREGEEVRPDHEAIWRTIPRYAEIPETVRCKRCREVIGLYTECIF